MASTTISSGQNSRGFTFFLTLSEGTQSLTDNYTPISWSLKLSCSSTGYGFSGYGVGWNCNIDGASVTSHDRYTSDRYSCTNGSTWTIASGTKNVTHNNDGTKVLSVSGTLDMASSPYGAGAMSFSGSFTLTDIPRQSTFTISNGTLNTAQNIVITSNVNTYRHTLRYECGSATGTINSTRIPASNATSATQSWTPPLSLAAQNTTGESVSVTVYCDTYTAASGGTLIGTSSKTVTMAIPASVKPSVTVSTACNPAAHLTTYGGYVQGKSTVTVTLSPTMSQGATIASRTVKIGTAQTYSPTSNSVTSTALTEAGDSISIQVTVTDSRGRSGTASTTIKVLAYEDPKITAISMIRTNSSGAALATGEYAKVTFSSSVSALGNHNTATYKLYYKTSTASSYSNATLSSCTNNYAVSNGTNIFSATVANSYMAYITVQDAFKTVTSVTVRVQSSAAFFSLDADNNAFSFGKLETAPNTFQVAWNSVFDRNVNISGDEVVTGSVTGASFIPTAKMARGSSDISLVPYVEQASGNRLAFLPADQVIIEKTTDGGASWTSAEVNDSIKRGLFSTGGNVTIPLLNNAKSTLCSVRVTFTAMKYNVPSGTSETQKYNYWNSSNVVSQERYSNLHLLWFWLSSNNDAIQIKVERATGANSTSWTTIFNEDWGAVGWSGSDWVRFSNGVFGGYVTQTSNYWNYRITFTSRYADGKTDFQSATQQSINMIKGFGENVWSASNNFMQENHLYSYDSAKNATFPATLKAQTLQYYDSSSSSYVDVKTLRPIDYIIEQGTASSASGGTSTLTWTYRKWNSGIAECWSKASWSTTSFTLWTNGVYQGGERPWWNFPSGLFNAVPYLQALHCTDGGTWFQDVITDGGTKTVSANNTCAFCCLRPSNYAPVPITTHLYAKGTWK